MKNIRLAVCSALIIMAGCCSVFACSSKGPQDPITGMISYPEGSGHSDGNTDLPDEGLEGTPFEGKKYYKGWEGKDMRLIVVPTGTKLAFEGIIESVSSKNRPPDWEEGAIKDVGGTTVEDAPRAEWTISGNGRGDYRDGNFPPSIPGLRYVNFETPPSVILAEDTPNVKALWKMTYDRDTAVRVLLSIWSDEFIRAIYLSDSSVPPGFDMQEIADRAKEPLADDGAKSLNNFELTATNAGSVDALRESFDSTLTQRAGEVVQTGDMVTRKFLRDDDSEFVVTMAEEARVIVKAGYIAMQGASGGDGDFYPTGRYDTKFFVTPPSSAQHEVNNSKLLMDFSTPTSPDYWTIDLHSGLESSRDLVWCWIEADAILKAEDTKISDPDDDKSFYIIDPDSYAVGGVFIQGLYSSGESSPGRNTLVYVVVADTEPPAHYKWEAAVASGTTGGMLNSNGAPITFRVFDNNPIIGSNGSHNNIFEVFDLANFEFVEASKRPTGAPANSDVFARYLEPVENGFDAKNLFPTLHYNVCVPVYAGFKVSGEPRNYTGPLPLVNDVLVLPLQKFVWKTADQDKLTISDMRIYNSSGDIVSSLGDLRSEVQWKGYSSYLVTVPPDAFTEQMGSLIANQSINKILSISGDLKASPPSTSLFSEGVPVDGGKVFYFGWNSQALKMFVSAADGITVRDSYPSGVVNADLSNRTPGSTGPNSIQALLDSRYSGAELAFATGYQDFVAAWDEPTSVDQLEAKLQANKLVTGGKLTGCTLPTDCNSPDGSWGEFNYVGSIIDNCRPNIALEIVNSKNEKAAVFGNLFAMGEHENLVKAIKGAGTGQWAWAADSNNGDKTYSSASTYYPDSMWEFNESIDTDLYLSMKDSMDVGTFKPWLFAFPSSAKDDLWASGYWNGDAVFNSSRLAFQQGSRDRLIFRYWVWDNINPFSNDSTMPNGVLNDGRAERSRFKSVSGFVNAEISLMDMPGFRGEVPVDKVWWPDYIFHNPSSGSAEECSISLQARDESGNPRKLKVWFRVVPPSRELIRTIEEKRNRQ